jgi:hypothetical protein
MLESVSAGITSCVMKWSGVGVLWVARTDLGWSVGSGGPVWVPQAARGAAGVGAWRLGLASVSAHYAMRSCGCMYVRVKVGWVELSLYVAYV